MRFKEFCIFILIFTVCYIVFFVFFDKLSLMRQNKKLLEKAKSLIQQEKYLLFAKFYGIQGVVSQDVIFRIYSNLRNESGFPLSGTALSYGVSTYEFVIILLYLEYLGLFTRKNISLVDDFVRPVSIMDQNMAQKYYSYFQSKSDYNTIFSSLGNDVLNDLSYLNQNFLIPGVRFLDSKMYYVGDYL